MSKPSGNGKTELEYDGAYQKESLKHMLYNSKDGTFLGRTSKQWGQLLIFYVIFYIILAALFAICMQGLFATLEDDQPKWKLESSLIGTNPGLGFRPISEQFERGSVIQYDGRKQAESDYWIELLNDFIKDYNNTEGRKIKHCGFNQVHNPQDVCIVDLNQLGECSPANSYGYKSRHPCIFLKLNKIYGWQPEYYDDPDDLPKEMPDELKQRINDTDQLERQQIWVTCHGHYGKDKENFENITYYPNQGFPAFYYPYINQPGYLSPIVAVQFRNPPPSTMLDVECRAWAKNIVYSGSNRDRMGSVTFQIIVD